MKAFARKAKVLPFEMVDDVLVVHPTGQSLSAGESVIEREITELHHVIEDQSIRRAVVDIGVSPHFGSLVIGALITICLRTRQNNGKSAFCQASAGMLETLQIMKVETVIPYFPTMAEALEYVRNSEVTEA